MRAVVDADDEDSPIDVVFSVLRVARRRRAVRYLRAADGPIDVRHLADVIASQEPDGRNDDERRERIQLSLQQTHLPKLDDAGFVEYDHRDGTVTPRPALAVCDRYLDVEAEPAETETAREGRRPRRVSVRSTRWPLAYGAVAATVGGVAGAADLLGAGAGQAAPWLAAVALLVGALAGIDLVVGRRSGG